MQPPGFSFARCTSDVENISRASVSSRRVCWRCGDGHDRQWHSSLCSTTEGVGLRRARLGLTISRHSGGFGRPCVAFHPILARASSLADREKTDVLGPSMPHHSRGLTPNVDGVGDISLSMMTGSQPRLPDRGRAMKMGVGAGISDVSSLCPNPRTRSTDAWDRQGPLLWHPCGPFCWVLRCALRTVDSRQPAIHIG